MKSIDVGQGESTGLVSGRKNRVLTLYVTGAAIFLLICVAIAVLVVFTPKILIKMVIAMAPLLGMECGAPLPSIILYLLQLQKLLLVGGLPSRVVKPDLEFSTRRKVQDQARQTLYVSVLQSMGK
jgi:hypothetical protein